MFLTYPFGHEFRVAEGRNVGKIETVICGWHRKIKGDAIHSNAPPFIFYSIILVYFLSSLLNGVVIMTFTPDIVPETASRTALTDASPRPLAA